MKTLRELREAKGMSQTALAMATGYRPESIWKWESGKQVPSAVRLRRLADVLGVTMDDIELTDNGNGRRNGDGR